MVFATYIGCYYTLIHIIFMITIVTILLFSNNITYLTILLIIIVLDIFVNILNSLGIVVKDNTVLKEGIQNIIGVVQSRNMDDSITTDNNLKSIKTQTFLDGIVESEFNKIIKYLDIKTKCK